MTYQYILYEKEGEIARIILNKPEKLNAMQFLGPGDDFSELLDALKRAEDDDDVKVVILKGAGRAFCTGHDLSKVGFLYGFGTGQPGERRPSQRVRLNADRKGMGIGHKQVMLCSKLTIAQVHGFCLEGGLLLALTCDFLLVADDTLLGFPGQRLGFAGGGEPSLYLLAHMIGLKRAVDLMLTGKKITGKEAERIGLVTRSVPPADLERHVESLAKALCFYPRDGIAIGKATQHLFYDQLGLTASFTTGYISHTLFTNLRFEPGEFNFFRQRRDAGAKGAFHERDRIFDALLEGKDPVEVS